nr:hypothetical protein [Leisingera aquaemixtae]
MKRRAFFTPSGGFKVGTVVKQQLNKLRPIPPCCNHQRGAKRGIGVGIGTVFQQDARRFFVARHEREVKRVGDPRFV